MIGCALDQSAGYTRYFNHFRFSCGLEVVPGHGEILRPGDGALDSKDLVMARVEAQLRTDPLWPACSIEFRHGHPHGRLVGRRGQRLPDMNVVLKDDSQMTLYLVLKDGRWIHLQLTSDEEISPGGTTSVYLAPGAASGLLANFASVLVRTGGHLAHVRPADDARGAEKARPKGLGPKK